jgi:aryl-alcohol dehydrogenase-like predicted oxidoreductase
MSVFPAFSSKLLTCPKASTVKMKYRVLGRTGLKVSELGMGGHEYARHLNISHFRGDRALEELLGVDELLETQDPRTNLIKEAIFSGINYFDTTLIEEAQSLGLALEILGKRDEVHLTAEVISPFRRIEGSNKSALMRAMASGVEERLKVLRTDRIDVFNLHMPADGYSREKFGAFIEALRWLRDEGKIGAIGTTCHQPRFLAELIREHDCFDVVTVPYNYHLKDPRDVLFPLCKEREVAFVAMKPFCWPYYGVPITYFEPESLPEGVISVSQTSLRWIMESPEVCTIIPGVNTLTELKDNVSAMEIDGGADEIILELCLNRALSQEGKTILRNLAQNEGVRRDIHAYASRALS